MKRFSALILAVLLTLSLGACSLHDASNQINSSVPGQNGQVNGTAMYANAARVLELMNAERAAAGLAPLVMDQALTDAAMLRAAEISVAFSHTRPDGSKCFTAFPSVTQNTYRAENLASGGKTPEAVMQGWMSSSGHKKNILSPNYTNVGIGCVEVNGKLYWSECFCSVSITPADIAAFAGTENAAETWTIAS